MKVAIEVKDRNEATLMKAGLDDPVVRAVVMMSGALSQLPDDKTRRRVLGWVKEAMADVEGG